MTSTNDIRRSFLDYFVSAGHAEVASAPLVPFSDPTLMFVNAGMVPFKNAFTGLETPPAPRIASSQKCVRAGGKHNDLDNVGYTARHHTFFEMLGNFSFGDYFKEEAILHAWTLLTREWGLPPERLTATVFHTDDEAFDLWRRIAGLPESRIVRIATADNFWSMGDTGPCGPCSEIFYDHGEHIAGGPPGSADEDGDRFVEIWNLVFMQFDQAPDGSRAPLPRPSIDTGMGLERIAAVMQGVHDNYDIDLFRALTGASAELTGTDPAGEGRASHRIIADHLRSCTFLLADGVMPSNEGRGYVLRRIMRRAIRHAHLLGTREPLLHRLVPTLVSEMGVAYPELQRAQALATEVLQREETQFRRTLEKGLKLLAEASETLVSGDELAGETAFRLHDTYGFPLDLTEDALRARGIGVDHAGFAAAMARQKQAARAAWKGSGEEAESGIWFDIAERVGATEFTGYANHTGEAQVQALVRDGEEVGRAGAGEEVLVVVNQTPFYAESGGQAGDRGTMRTVAGAALTVLDTTKALGRLHIHKCRVDAGVIVTGDSVSLHVDDERRSRIRANHSATHLLHAALRKRLGEHVTQKGSLVADDRLRFDFAHPRPLTPEDVAAIEQDVNAEIRANEVVDTRLMRHDEALAAGALALFGEKYGDEVRVLSMGRAAEGGRSYSVELCGGTHVRATGDIALFKIISEGAVAAGVRRIEALTGEAARQWLVDRDSIARAIAGMVRTTPEEAVDRVTALIEDKRRLERELAAAKRELAMAGGAARNGAADAAVSEPVAGVPFLGRVLNGLDPRELRPLLEQERKAVPQGVAALVTVFDGRATVAVGVGETLLQQVDAVHLVRAAVEVLGGTGGGGRGGVAQGGGPDGARAGEALEAVRAALAEQLG
ncbi:alanine--tRNA ligase [Erythrobacteraceae bacterium CFH 75059]|uniref:alanine--tRNA ligase n=1 Tax=Qipengyuania thermophila TaxID=2509361 RepID=UPI00101FE0DC|nr:alanine--tRNA ligase [Qipengyuania thermophila]TCD05422.1 alanine--tRNA ligase [Erythrobacteraceae bacterium CFH 75059]